MRLNQIDTNLLVALDVLLEERHVTRAAQRLSVTQSAMSQTLGRLRETLDDPILVRNGPTMSPTPRALALMGPLRDALRALEETLNVTPEFDANTERRVFRFACLDVYGLSIAPALVREVAAAGPGLSVKVSTLRVDRVYDELRGGDLDLALAGPHAPPSDISTTPAVREKLVGLARAEHPIFDREITLESYAGYGHVVFSLTGRGDYPIDRRLATLGYERRIAGVTDHFLSAPAMVLESDLIVNVPRSAAALFVDRWPLRAFDPPFEPMRYQTFLASPSFLDADPAQTWFRARAAEICERLLGACDACPILGAHM